MLYISTTSTINNENVAHEKEQWNYDNHSLFNSFATLSLGKVKQQQE